MGEAKRKTYTASAKAKAGLEAIREVKTANEIGPEHGVHPVQVGQWKKEILEQAGTLFETQRGRQKVDEQAGLARSHSASAARSSTGRSRAVLNRLSAMAIGFSSRQCGKNGLTTRTPS